MSTSCKKSCNTCGGGGGTGGGGSGGGGCKDSNNKCASWARRGECRRNPAYMLNYCKKSCNQCASSSDTDTTAKCKFVQNS
ncbi:uncharacterized protein LOC143059293 [Mytilus galloprovincialis]|uniref:uncharacterized protein LOC143059293 n=1 Tax=Mytilus galloprovincialis TaxID=29158 RepID=UPI003F7BDA00